MIPFILTVFILLNPSVTEEKHPIHVSLTNVEYNQEAGVFDIAFKIFTDDFEEIIAQKYGVALHLGQPSQHRVYQQYVQKYLLEHFRLIINNKDFTASRLVFKSKKMNHEATWFYYEFEFFEPFHSVTIKNSLLNDLFHDQTNLLIFNYKNTEKAFSMDNDMETVSFTL